MQECVLDYRVATFQTQISQSIVRTWRMVMKQVERTEAESMVDFAGGSTDSNRLYSILLDARASKVSESMYDIAEALVESEKENAKNALDRLWSLKKNIQDDVDTATIDMLIQHYQEKVDILRDREESIRKVGTDSRSLLEDKRRRDSEIATVKQEIGDCSRELEQLSLKLDQLKTKEQELTLIEVQVRKELESNANEVINGLYEIILSHDALGGGCEETCRSEEARPAVDFCDEPVEQEELKGQEESERRESGTEESREDEEGSDFPGEDAVTSEMRTRDTVELSEPREDFGDFTEKLAPWDEAALEVPYPKSVVRTTRGRVIGEYYYDAKAYKNERHYVYNSRFLREQVARAISILEAGFDQVVLAEAMQIVRDALERIKENEKLHFEISTNEILSESSLEGLLQSMKNRDFLEASRFCTRLRSKIRALGANYGSMLQEQMDRYLEES